MAPNDKDSNRRGGKHTSKPSSSEYPTPWSKWVWSSEHNCNYRGRFLDSKGTPDYEYESRQEPSQPSANVLSVPRAGPAPATSIPQISSQYEPQDNYTTDTLADSVALISTEDTAAAQLENFPQPQAHVSTRNDKTDPERFDKNYKVHEQWEFRFGKVFKVIWSEPPGEGRLTGGTKISVRGEKFQKVRRFVIINAKNGHCICLPIMTYEGRGTIKPGVHAEDHAIIYTSHHPKLLDGETRMTKTPIKVVPSDGRHKLDHASRLNYAKVYTVEYNVKVWFIGKIHRDSEGDLIVAYNDVHPPLQAPRRPAGLASGAPSSYQAPYSQYTPASFPSVAAGYSTTPSSLQPTTTQHQTSNYATVATASYGLVQSPSYTAPTSYPEQYPSTAPADQSYRDPQLPSDTVYE